MKIKKETRGNFTIQISSILIRCQILLCHLSVYPDLVLKSVEWNMVMALETGRIEGERRPVVLQLIDSSPVFSTMQTLNKAESVLPCAIGC